MNLNKPIILIGTQRSGTTMLGRFLSMHPHIAYWVEPNPIWIWGNERLPDDVMTIKHARPEVVVHIQEQFSTFTSHAGKQRFCEKTPNNCLRLKFVKSVLPDALFIHIVRDGRAVVRSSEKKRTKGHGLGAIKRRIREVPIKKWPMYFSKLRDEICCQMLGRSLPWHGPRPTSWNIWQEKYSPLEVSALQWVHCVKRARKDSVDIGSRQYLEIRYEELMLQPASTFNRILEFAALRTNNTLIDFVSQHVDQSCMNKWRDEFKEDELDLIRPHMESLMNEIGYGWH